MNAIVQTGDTKYTLSDDGKMLSVFIPVRFAMRGGRKQIIAPPGGIGVQRTHRDEAMIQAVAKAWKWRQMLDRKEAKTLSEIASKEKIGLSYVCRIFDLSFLAPDIVAAILDGTQPPGMSLRELGRGIPALWEEQRIRFLFVGG